VYPLWSLVLPLKQSLSLKLLIKKLWLQESELLHQWAGCSGILHTTVCIHRGASVISFSFCSYFHQSGYMYQLFQFLSNIFNTFMSPLFCITSKILWQEHGQLPQLWPYHVYQIQWTVNLTSSLRDQPTTVSYEASNPKAEDKTMWCLIRGTAHLRNDNKWVMSNCEIMIISRGNPKSHGEEICTSATSCTTNITQVHR